MKLKILIQKKLLQIYTKEIENLRSERDNTFEKIKKFA